MSISAYVCNHQHKILAVLYDNSTTTGSTGIVAWALEYCQGKRQVQLRALADDTACVEDYTQQLLGAVFSS